MLVGGCAVLACAISVLIAPSSAPGAVSFQLVPSQSAVSIPGTSQTAYDLKMTTNAQQAERFLVEVQRPRFGLPPSGMSLEETGLPRLSGAGTIEGAVVTSASIAGCALRGPGNHGVFGTTYGVFLTLPPSSETTLAFTFALAPQAPWPRTRYAPTFVAEPRAWTGPSTLPGPVRIPAPEPLVFATSGVEIRFRTDPHAPQLPVTVGEPVGRVRVGEEIKIRGGSTDPPLRRKRLRLMFVGPGGERPKLLAKVRTRRSGRFSYSGWEPERKGSYEFWFEYRSQSEQRASDFTCSRTFELVGAKKKR